MGPKFLSDSRLEEKLYKIPDWSFLSKSRLNKEKMASRFAHLVD